MKFDKQSGLTLFKVVFVIFVLQIILLIFSLITNTPKHTFKKGIKYISKITETLESEHNSIKVNTNLKYAMENNSKISSQNLNIQIETDNNEKTAYGAVNWKNADKEIINVKAKTDTDMEHIYLDLTNMVDDLDKIIQIDLSEVSNTEKVPEITDYGKFKKIILKQVNENIKKEYLSSESVNELDHNYKKNIFSVNGKQVTEIIKKVVSDLSQDENFLACFTESDKVKENLENIKTNLEKNPIEEKITFNLELYTRGLFHNIEIAKITILADEKEKSSFKFVNTKEEYQIKYIGDGFTLEGEADKKLADIQVAYTITKEPSELDITNSTIKTETILSATKEEQGLYNYTLEFIDKEAKNPKRNQIEGTIEIGENQYDIKCTSCVLNDKQQDIDAELKTTIVYDEPITDFDVDDSVTLDKLDPKILRKLNPFAFLGATSTLNTKGLNTSTKANTNTNSITNQVPKSTTNTIKK